MRHKNILLSAILCVLIPGQAKASSAVTTENFPACTKKEWIEDIRKFVAAKDINSFNAYINTGKCIILEKGVNVTVTNSSGTFGNNIEFAYSGVKLWTVRDALRITN